MYTWENPCRNEPYKSRKSSKNMPSFSSTLLDEIYRSIDEKKTDEYKVLEENPVKISSFRRACLVEKWMEIKENGHEEIVAKRKQQPLLENNKLFQDSDLLFFSSTSSSSDSSGALSSSDTEFFGGGGSITKPNKVSCFSSTRPKPVRTGVGFVSKTGKESGLLFDDHKVGDDLIKSKSRALKIYANLKKVKQPISPGGRLTSFINSLFTNANGKKNKSKNSDTNRGFQDLKSSSSTCSSASSFSRSCLSKYSPNSREKMRNGNQRSVRFHPVSVIVDEDSRPCGQKSIYDEGKRPPLPTNALKELKFSKMEKADDYNDDDMSDSSSDLFELDHLTFLGNDRFCEELPVYETTHLDTNRRLIR